jgi:hypothetical protein
MSTERNLEETVIDCEIDTPTLPLLHCPPSGAIVRYEMFSSSAHEMFSSSAPLMICNTNPDGVDYDQMVTPPNVEVPKPIRVKKMKLINDDDLAMGFAILALCYMLWLATDFILQYGGGWIG